MSNSRILVVLATLLLAGCGPEPNTATTSAAVTTDQLAALSASFEKRVEQVGERTWVAIGYGLANSILVEGDDGLIVIDTTESMEAGSEIAKLFRQKSNKPLKAIIYTHNHADHVFGAQAFIDELAQDGTAVEVLAQEKTAGLVYRIASEYRPIISQRSNRMFGSNLSDDQFLNNGLGPRLRLGPESHFGFVAPTETFDAGLNTVIAGLNIQLIHAPGETDDQLFVWLPQLGLLAPGDNFYKAFPNLYTIRGTPHRSLKQWAASIDRMRSLPIRHLVPSHTAPMSEPDEIYRALTDYRDGIRYVHDQSVRWINAGLTATDLMHKIKLPPHLASSPYLQEFYGAVDFSAHAVFAGNLGWFSGNPSELRPEPLLQQAQRIAALAGGEQALRDAFNTAAEAGEHQWLLQLSDWLLHINPDDVAVKTERAKSLEALGMKTTNPNARHYYLSSAKELRDGPAEQGDLNASDEMLRAIPMRSIFDGLAANLQAEKTLELDSVTGFEFTDSGETYTLWIRRGVVEHHPGFPTKRELDMHVKVDSLNWRKLLAKRRSPIKALATDFEFEKGGRIEFAKLLKLFDSGS